MRALLLFLTLFCTTVIFANNDPVLIPSATIMNPQLCSYVDEPVNIFEQIKITDPDLDIINVLGISSSNQSVVPSPYYYIFDYGLNSDTLSISISGELLTAGSSVISLTVTDGNDTVTIDLPAVTVTQTPQVSISSDPSFCASEGPINLNDFVTPKGGLFSYEGIIYENGMLDPAILGIDYTTYTPVEYVYQDGLCSAYAYFSVLVKVSPNVVVQTGPTTCNASTGTALALVTPSGETLSQAWSNGVTGNNTISDLGAGQYVYYHTDTNNCLTTVSFIIEPSDASLDASVTNVTCYGFSDGEISLASTGLTNPIEYQWSSGHITKDISGLRAGTYTVYAKDANNCSIVKNVTVYEPSKVEVYLSTTILPSCGGLNGEIMLDPPSGGTGTTYTYEWSNGATTSNLQNVGFGTYTVVVKDAVGCEGQKTIYLSEDAGVDIYGDVVPAACGEENGKIYTEFYIWSGESIESIVWSNGATTTHLIDVPGGEEYTCTVTIANTNCKALKGWYIPVKAPEIQDICIITVDTTTTTNLVVWEKAQPVGIDYYNIYRETANQGEYILIDTVSALNVSTFNDVVASPQERSWNYKISAVNFCGVESPISAPHRTIHLDIVDVSGLVEVSWNAYMGAQFTEYVVNRYTTADGWEIAGIVPANTTYFVDNINPATPGLDYFIEFELTQPCSAEKAQDFNTVRSNRERGQFKFGTGVEGSSNNAVLESYLSNIKVYPNPVKDQLTFVQESNKTVNYTFYSLSGKVVMEIVSGEQTVSVDMNSIESGMYLVKISSEGTQVTKRVVKM